jgi:dihydroneopterin aldolase/2-amino-4-hydroxy-6-hydroxymethyldihydropteridine diphosphokinase
VSPDRIIVRGIEAFGYHGVLPEERRQGQPFVVDLEVRTDVSEAAAADDLAMTIDYAVLAKEAVAIVQGEPSDLIETVAIHIAEQVLTHDRVSSVQVTVHKPQAPVGVPFADVAVTVERQAITPVRAVFGLGSNVGDRPRHLERAIETLRATPHVVVVAVSPFVETDPVGGPEQPDFLNAVVVTDTTLSPAALLALAHQCESAARRERGKRWGPRTLDVDVLAYGDLTSDDPELTLPHPRAAERAFVLVPWSAVDPGFVVAGRSVADWAADVDASGVRPFARERAG